ncbi:hypothetical protein LSTR_LSTR004599 [Laodelphax striatellus]|uniref:Leucine-rich repeat-containing protein 27 n=1 Tax=Laodelphax striatellus TaxID=195883 RepID=A0A482WUS2_LAOST|nr:hypothetical protein LSTR_LSTR004599 [Laodelphax striatellus]
MNKDEKDPHETYIDLSWLNLRSFPLATFEKLENIQHIYLEGNKIRKLDDDFFPTFQQLQWLDIRNNELEEIPVTISNHPNLRVLLLEDNNLQQLPVELGSVPNLKGIQLKRNPIIYPPPEVLSEGSSSIIKFLQNEWNSLQAESEPNTSCSIKSSSKTNKETKKSKNTSKLTSQLTNSSTEHQTDKKVHPEKLNECMKVMKLEKIDHKIKNKMSIGWSTGNAEPGDEDAKSQGDIEKQEQVINSNEVNEYNPEKLESDQHPDYERAVSDLEYIRRQPQISSKMLRDMWMYNIRQVLEQQEAELQRQKNKESLKKWQQETKEIQQTCRHKPGEKPQLKLPYGIDEELTMPSRKDLHTMDKKGKQKRRISKDSNSSGHESISSKINSILCTLQELRKKRLDRSLSPRAEQETLTAEIKQIAELQRSLASLKHFNYKEA